MSTHSDTPHSVVIGGGIVGICSALYLQRAGHRVSLIDPAEPGESTAKWSCGQMAVSEVIPLSKKGILKNIPRWLADQEGPLALQPAALPRLLPWFIRFLACARAHTIEDIAQSLASLTRPVYQDYAVLLDDCGGQSLMGTRPVLELFDHGNDLEEEREYLDVRAQLGFRHRHLNGGDIADLEPAFAGKFQHGLLFEDWTGVRDTQGLMVALTRHFVRCGGIRLLTQANELLAENGRVHAVRLATGTVLAAEHVVLAAGVGSRRFFPALGLKIPLAPVAGYQAVLPQAGVDIRHSTIYFNGGFCFAPMDRGLQIGGTIEFAPADAPPNFKRADIILNKARRILPQLNTDGLQYGVGYRPFLPDTKPVIGLAPQHRNVALAFGHGQLGLTLGATTGRLVADLLTGRTPDIDLTPFQATRF